MLPDASPLDPRALESLLAFWRDAGVDVCLEDEPLDRLSRPAPALVTARAAGEAAAAPLSIEVPSHGSAVAEARQAAAAAGTIAELRAAVEAFGGFDLKAAGARRTLFARGPDNAALMVIGEAPSADDESGGQVFGGAVGRLLDRMLAAAGFAERAFITNTVFWRPGTRANPSVGDCAVCAPFLEQAIHLLRPRAILLLGQAAARTVLGREEPITALRGRWLEHVSAADAHVTPALATLHPAFLMTQPAAKAMAWRDLLALASQVDQAASDPH